MITIYFYFELMKRILMLLVAVMSALPHIYGQNKIDDHLDMRQDTGTSTFTSVVERHPATKKVRKVVKVLKTSSHNAASFAKVFRAEAHTGTFKETVDGYKVTMLLTVEKPECTRIYMLTYDKRRISGNDAGVTAIIKYK